MQTPNFLYKYMPVRVGSSVTCDPIPENADYDLLILVSEDKYQILISELIDNGFQLAEPNMHYRGCETEFNSWRNVENVNVILTEYSSFYYSFLACSRICKKLNVLDKKQRISIFQAGLYENYNG